MPASVTPERVKLAQSYGAEVILTPAEKGIPGAIEKAKQLQEQHHAYIPDQFNNPFNVLAHELTTGLKYLNKQAGSGRLRCRRRQRRNHIRRRQSAAKSFGDRVRIIAVEPAESLCFPGEKLEATSYRHRSRLIPTIFDKDLVDEIITVTGDEALEGVKMLSAKDIQ